VTMGTGRGRLLCEAANRYFRERISAVDVVRTVSGAQQRLSTPVRKRRERRDDTQLTGRRQRRAVSRSLARTSPPRGVARGESGLRADAVLSDAPRWLRSAAGRAAIFAWDRFETEIDIARERWRFLTEAQSRRLVGAYGTQRQRRCLVTPGEEQTRAGLWPELTGPGAAISWAGNGALSATFCGAARSLGLTMIGCGSRGAGARSWWRAPRLAACLYCLLQGLSSSRRHAERLEFGGGADRATRPLAVCGCNNGISCLLSSFALLQCKFADEKWHRRSVRFSRSASESLARGGALRQASIGREKNRITGAGHPVMSTCPWCRLSLLATCFALSCDIKPQHIRRIFRIKLDGLFEIGPGALSGIRRG